MMRHSRRIPSSRWAELELELTAGGRSTTVCTARVAIPAAEGDNPWTRRGEEWRPRAAA